MFDDHESRNEIHGERYVSESLDTAQSGRHRAEKTDDIEDVFAEGNFPLAHRMTNGHCIPGLYFDPSRMIYEELAECLWSSCLDTFFKDGDVNQVMLFERAGCDTEDSGMQIHVEGLSSGNSENEFDYREAKIPTFLITLLSTLSILLAPTLPSSIHDLLFPTSESLAKRGQARQIILNHYRPGEGISPHVDLLKRYGDGIIGVSLHSGCVMNFAKIHSGADTDTNSGNSTQFGKRCTRQMSSSREDHNKAYIYLPARSVIVLSGEARYEWSHGIDKFRSDLVESVDGASVDCIPRVERISITYRWLLPGADVVGYDDG